MLPTAKIESRQNPRIKNVVKLKEKSQRKKQNRFVIEGVREISRALTAQYLIEELYFCPEYALPTKQDPLWQQKHTQYFEITRSVLEKISHRSHPDGLIALAQCQTFSWQDLPKHTSPLYIVVEQTEKPGNLGAILRTADCIGAHAVICCQPNIDLFNPNVIRSSQGSFFHTPTIVTSNEDAAQYLQKHNVVLYTTSPDHTQAYWQKQYTQACAIILGSEDQGLSPFWLQHPQAQAIHIPMHGSADSLNLSVSAAIVGYEALRQRSLIPL